MSVGGDVAVIGGVGERHSPFCRKKSNALDRLPYISPVNKPNGMINLEICT